MHESVVLGNYEREQNGSTLGRARVEVDGDLLSGNGTW